MSKLSRMASALSFAHLAGIGSMRGKKARAEDNEDDDRKDDLAEENDSDEDDDRERDNNNGKKSRKAKRAKAGEDAEDDDRREDDDDERADDDQDNDEGDKKSRRAKGKSASDDDDPDAEDDEDEMHGRSAAASARRRERARCAAIFGSRYAARNPVLAANLAFGTSMTRKQALNVLRDTPADSPAAAGRASKNPNLGSGGDHSPSRQATIAGRWDRAMTKVRGK